MLIGKKRFFSILILILCTTLCLYGEISAQKALEEASKKESVYDSAEYLESTAKKTTDKSQKRAMYIYLANLKEQMGLYTEASAAYVLAAGIAAPDAEGTGRNPPEKLVLDAVRAELSAGNYANAEQYLRSAVKKSDDVEIQARLNLYTQWCALCKAQNIEQTKTAVATLESYLKVPEMISVKPAILLTLWHLTEKSSFADTLKKEFPASPETAIVNSKFQILPAPFWYFIPRKGNTNAAGLAPEKISDTIVPEKKSAPPAPTAPVVKESGARLQLGLFRKKDNAQALCDSAKKKGFSAKIIEENRSSGTFYIVYVSENGDKNMSKKLKAAGFENYPLK